MTEEQRKVFGQFKSALIRAWCMDTEDSFTDKDRKGTREAHAKANELEIIFLDSLTCETETPQVGKN